MNICPICECVNRHKVDVDLLNGDPLEDIIARKYGKFTLDQLRVHAVTHVKVPEAKDNESIATRLATKEADTLSATCGEYMATLKRLGAAIDMQISGVESGEIALSQALSKSVVDLYLGTGNQIRETVRLLIEAEKDMNAAEADGGNVSSIRKLTEAIDRSRKVG